MHANRQVCAYQIKTKACPVWAGTSHQCKSGAAVEGLPPPPRGDMPGCIADICKNMPGLISEEHHRGLESPVNQMVNHQQSYQKN